MPFEEKKGTIMVEAVHWPAYPVRQPHIYMVFLSRRSVIACISGKWSHRPWRVRFSHSTSHSPGTIQESQHTKTSRLKYLFQKLPESMTSPGNNNRSTRYVSTMRRYVESVQSFRTTSTKFLCIVPSVPNPNFVGVCAGTALYVYP